jgi:hypothetical protein
MEKYYQLGGNASIFWDPQQPENDVLLKGEVKALKQTTKVAEHFRKGGLVLVQTEEAKAIIEKNEELQKKTKADEKAQLKLNKAAEKEEGAKEILREAEIKLKQAAEVQAENDQLKLDKQALLDRITELEAPPKPPADDKSKGK